DGGRAEARLPAERQRPTESGARPPAPARPLRRRRVRVPRRDRGERRGCRRRVQRARAVRGRWPPRPRRGGGRLEGGRREGRRRLPAQPSPGHCARARRRGGEEGLTSREGVRAGLAPGRLTEAWGRRDVAGVFAAGESALQQGRAVTGLVWTIAEHIRLVRACRAFAAEGVSTAEAAKRLRKREFPVRKAYAQAEAFPDDELRAALVRLAQLEVAVKGGSRLPDELELERALVDVTRPAAQ